MRYFITSFSCLINHPHFIFIGSSKYRFRCLRSFSWEPVFHLHISSAFNPHYFSSRNRKLSIRDFSQTLDHLASSSPSSLPISLSRFFCTVKKIFWSTALPSERLSYIILWSSYCNNSPSSCQTSILGFKIQKKTNTLFPCKLCLLCNLKKYIYLFS